MVKTAKIPTRQFQRSVFIYGIVNGIAFVLVILLFRLFRAPTAYSLAAPLDCLVLCLVGLIQIRRLVRKTGIAMRFLQSFSLIFFTGAWGFLLFGGLMLAWAFIDPGLLQLFKADPSAKLTMTPVIVLVSQGIGGSIIAALIDMMYSDRFADHEASP